MGSPRRGDIVWARALYPHSWWPGLVLRVDIFGVLVSFFEPEPPPRYFLESEVCSFDQNFESRVKNVRRETPSDKMLNRALILLGQRAALSLRCPCREPPDQEAEAKNLVGVGWNCKEQVLEAAKSFRPAATLGFLLDMAVSPWTEDEGLVVAVTAVAEIKRFRRHSSAEQKLKYQEARGRDGTNPVRDDIESIVTIAREAATLGDECQVLSEQVDNNLTDCITNRMNMKDSLESLHKVEVNCPRLKRQLEQPTLVHPSFKLRKTKPFFSFSRAYAYLQRNGDSFKIDLFDGFSSGSLLIFDVPLIEHTPGCSSIVEIGKVEEHEENVDTVNDSATCISYFSMLKPQGSIGISKDSRTFKSYVDAARSTMGVRSKDVKVDCISTLLHPLASKFLYRNVRGNQASNDKFGITNEATIKYLVSPHLTINRCKILTRDSECATSVMNNREVSKVSFEERYKENIELHQHATSDLSFNTQSQLDQQSEALNYGHSRTLHMKFPKGFYLPSKEELVKKFSSFGPVDSLNTKVSPYTGAAKVVFVDHMDAVTAYEYAKRKRSFWLNQISGFGSTLWTTREGLTFCSPCLLHLVQNHV